MKQFVVQVTGQVELSVCAPVLARTAREFIPLHHYSRKVASIMFTYGMYRGGELIGVVTFGMPASPYVSVSICNQANRVIELNRIAFIDGHERNDVSHLIAFALRSLPWSGYVVSYADSEQGHTGTIYQATNWNYGGASKARTDISAGGKHPRHHCGDPSIRQHRSPKHRYWLAVGKDRRRLSRESLWESLPYPKDRTPWTSPAHTLYEDGKDVLVTGGLILVNSSVPTDHTQPGTYAASPEDPAPLDCDP